MIDLINRQDAIDAVLDMKVEQRVSWMDAVVDTLDALPSAQPDKDMIHLQREQAYMQGWEDGQKALREEIWEDGRDRLD